MHVDQVVEAVVVQNLRIEDHDHVNAEEHLEHVLVEVEIDRPFRLRIGAAPVEHHALALAPDRTAQLVWAETASVIANVILENQLFLGQGAADELSHRPAIAFQRRVQRADEAVDAETVAHFDHSPLGGAAGGDDRVKVAAIPVRHPNRVEHHAPQIFLKLAGAIKLDRRAQQSFLEDARGVSRQTSRHLAANVRHVTQHRRPTHQPAVTVVDGNQHQMVGGMTDGAVALVGIVGEEDVLLPR